MATRIPRTKQLLSLPSADIDKMSESELRDAVQILASAANKRLKRLAGTESGKMSPAYQSAMKRSYTTSQGGKFGTEGKTRNQLRNEFKAIKGFMESKTGSVEKWGRYKKKVYDRMGGDFGGDATKESQFWKMYRELESEHGIIGYMQYGSKETQADLRRVINGDGYKEILKEVNNMNVSPRRKDREEYIKNLTDEGFILNEKHRRVKINTKDPDDVKTLMTMRIMAAYEQEQTKRTSTDGDPFTEVQRN